MLGSAALRLNQSKINTNGNQKNENKTMKKFIYCESTEGGMQKEEYNFDYTVDRFNLFGWMHESCKEQDTKLLEWANSCKIGDYFTHRLGVCFRVNVNLTECTSCSGYRYYQGKPCGQCKGTGLEEN